MSLQGIEDLLGKILARLNVIEKTMLSSPGMNKDPFTSNDSSNIDVPSTPSDSSYEEDYVDSSSSDFSSDDHEQIEEIGYDVDLVLGENEIWQRRFNSLRFKRLAEITIEKKDFPKIWPFSTIAVREASAKGSLDNHSKVFKKTVECLGVNICSTCDLLHRPPTTIMKQDDDLSSFHTEKWTKCRSCKGDLSHHVCEGKFQVFRPSTSYVNREALSPITITVLVPCSLHAMPPRIRQTFLEHKQLSKAVVVGQTVRIVDRDPAGKANNQMHRQRVRRLKSNLKKNRSVELKDLQKLGVYHSSKDLMTFLIRAPYEQRAMITSKGLTLR